MPEESAGSEVALQGTLVAPLRGVASPFDDLDQLLAALVDAPTEPVVRFAPPRDREPNVIIDPELLREAERMLEGTEPPTKLFARGTTPPPFTEETTPDPDRDLSESDLLAIGEGRDEMDRELLDDAGEVSDSEILAIRNVGETTDDEIRSLRVRESSRSIIISIDALDDTDGE